MIKISGRSSNRIAGDELLTRKAAQRDDESRVAATLQTTRWFVRFIRGLGRFIRSFCALRDTML